LGLFINAITIDVFAASKVAFTFWSLSGLVLATYYVAHPKIAKEKEVAFFKKIKKIASKQWMPLLLTTLFFFLIYQNPFTEKSAILNFTTNPTGSEHIAAARCFLRTGSVTVCRGDLIYSTQPDLYAFILIPFLKIYNNPGMYFVLNSILAFSSLWLFSNVIKKISRHSFIKISAFTLLISNKIFITAVIIFGV